MARIVRFRDLPQPEYVRPHTEVECGYRIFMGAAGAILQLDTYGSDERQIPGKVSQSLQVDEYAARELLTLIRRAFPSLA